MVANEGMKNSNFIPIQIDPVVATGASTASQVATGQGTLQRGEIDDQFANEIAKAFQS